MNVHRAETRIDADPGAVASIILNIAQLAEWNPALLSTGTEDAVARLDHPYPVATRIPARATLTYVQANSERIVWRLDVAGSVETGEWNFESDGKGTRVTHTMTHSGALFAVMQRAMASVPSLRLGRLKQRAENEKWLRAGGA